MTSTQIFSRVTHVCDVSQAKSLATTLLQIAVQAATCRLQYATLCFATSVKTGAEHAVEATEKKCDKSACRVQDKTFFLGIASATWYVQHVDYWHVRTHER